MLRRYQLYGFSSGATRAPYFTEPVFTDGKNLFVQVASENDDRVSKFIQFDEKVDLHEHAMGSSSAVGDKCTYAVIDNGDRLIFGDRDYVGRYLTQNMRNYIDTPYFLNECIKFTDKKLPEFGFVRSKRDLLELAVAVNSIKEFARSTPNVRRWLMESFIESRALQYKKLENEKIFGKSKTIFGAWRTFASDRNHIVAESDRWKDIERDFLAIYDDDFDLANIALAEHFVSCKSIISDWQQENLSEVVQNLTIEKLSKILNDGKEEKSKFAARNMLTIYYGKPVYRHEPTRSVRNWIANALSNKKTNYIKISVQIYFISVALKVTIELLDNEIIVESEE